MAARRKRARPPDAPREPTWVPFSSTSTVRLGANALHVPPDWPRRVSPHLTTKNVHSEIDRVVLNATHMHIFGRAVAEAYVRLAGDAVTKCSLKACFRILKAVHGKIDDPAVHEAARRVLPERWQSLGAVPGDVCSTLWTQFETSLFLYCTDTLWEHALRVACFLLPDHNKGDLEKALQWLRDNGADEDAPDCVPALRERCGDAAWNALQAHAAVNHKKKEDGLSQAVRLASRARLALLARQQELVPDPQAVRRFALVPEAAVKRVFVTIDTDTVHWILKELLKRGVPKGWKPTPKWLARDPPGYVKKATKVVGATNKKDIPCVQQFEGQRIANYVWRAPAVIVPGFTPAQKRQNFLRTVDVCHVLDPAVFLRREDGLLPRSFVTDGVQVNMGFERRFERLLQWPVDKGPPAKPLTCNADTPNKACTFGEATRGLFKAEELRMADLEAALEDDGRVVGVDPGVANVFTAVSMSFGELKAREGRFEGGTRADTNAVGMSRGQYYANTGASHARYRGDAWYAEHADEHAYWKRSRGWIHPNVRAAHKRLGKEGLFKVRDADAALRALKLRMTIIHEHTLAWSTSRNAARQRFRRDSIKQHAVDTLLARLLPPRDADKSIVVFGNFFGRRAIAGETLAAPVRTVRRALAKRTRVLRINEHRTSRVCNQCEQETPKAKAHPKHTRQLSVHRWKKRLVACARAEHPDAWPRSVHKGDLRGEGRDGDALRVVCGDEKKIVETSLTLAEARDKRFVTQPKNGMYACETCCSCWARDVNAAANMVWAFHEIATQDGKRPLALQRKTKISGVKRQRTA